MIKKHFWLYVLQLEENKWYIGITTQTPEKRFREHLGGRKTYWTEKYRPIKIADTKSLGDLDIQEAKSYEDKVTKTYMQVKGINNVRGGSFTDKSDYVVRSGYIFDKFGWEAVTLVMLQTLIIIALTIDKYL